MWRPRDFVVVPAALVAVGGLIWGGRATYRTLRNWTPAVMTCAEYAARPPDKDWVRLTGCAADVEHIGFETLSEQVDGHTHTRTVGVYVALTPAGSAGRAKLALFADHGALLRLGGETEAAADTEAAARALSGEIEGMRMDLLALTPHEREDLRALHLHLADDFAVLDWEGRPRPLWLSAGVLLAGCSALGLIARRRRSKKSAQLAEAKLLSA